MHFTHWIAGLNILQDTFGINSKSNTQATYLLLFPNGYMSVYGSLGAVQSTHGWSN